MKSTTLIYRLSVFLLILNISDYAKAAFSDVSSRDWIADQIILCVTRAPATRAFINLRQNLREIVGETADILQSGKSLTHSNMGEEFNAAIANQEDISWMRDLKAAGVHLEMANPGVREFVATRFIKRFSDMVDSLPEAEQVKLLQRFTSGRDLPQKTGISYLLLSREFNDPVWKFLAQKNEWTNVLNAIQKYALEKLADIDSVASWGAASWVISSGDALAKLSFIDLYRRHATSKNKVIGLNTTVSEMKDLLKAKGVEASLAFDLFEPQNQKAKEEIGKKLGVPGADWTEVVTLVSAMHDIKPLLSQ